MYDCNRMPDRRCDCNRYMCDCGLRALFQINNTLRQLSRETVAVCAYTFPTIVCVVLLQLNRSRK